MLVDGSQNLPSALAMVEAVYRGAARELAPVSKDRLAQRAGHFAAGVRFGLDEPGAMRRLHTLTGDLAGIPGLSALLPRVLDGALSLTAADFGTIQLLDPVSGYRAVQATPLADYAGRLVGMVSTHYRRPQHPPETDLRIMELYGDFAGQAIATHLGAAHDGGPGGLVSQAVISALLGPGRGSAGNRARHRAWLC
jgi:GAF domain-containing protein